MLTSLTLKTRPRPPECRKGRGYVGRLLAAINETWPHPDHMFLNVGVSGAPDTRMSPTHPGAAFTSSNSTATNPNPNNHHLSRKHAACGLSCVANDWCSEGFLPRERTVDLLIYADATEPRNYPQDIEDEKLYLELIYQRALHRARAQRRWVYAGTEKAFCVRFGRARFALCMVGSRKCKCFRVLVLNSLGSVWFDERWYRRRCPRTRSQ